jgi:hypothetical protein
VRLKPLGHLSGAVCNLSTLAENEKHRTAARWQSRKIRSVSAQIPGIRILSAALSQVN